MILLRTQAVDDRLEAFAQHLETLSGMPVLYLIDERKGPVACGDRGKVSITREGCEALGLYCPHDFAWRCGDYGFYLARAIYPEVSHFWMIENDVRVAGSHPGALFAKFDGEPAAMVASYLEPAHAHWFWLNTVRARDAAPYKCFFPVVRLSAGAVDLLLAKRRDQARRWARRRLWANDEGFVATAMVASGGTILDLNDGPPQVYRTDQFSFEPPIDGDAPLASDAEVALFHPVLFGEALRRKQLRLAERAPKAGFAARALGKFRRIASLDAVAGAINRRSPW